MSDYVTFFDTTCRDGKQAAGNHHGVTATVRIAHQLATLGVDIMEAGFAASSAEDFACIKAVADEVPIRTASLARATESDIQAAARALENAQLPPRLHIVIATSDIHLAHKLQLSREAVLERIGTMVTMARQYVDDVQFSAEDASRSDRAFLANAASVAVAAGASTINLPDTVGYLMPTEYGEMIRDVANALPSVQRGTTTLSVHCHNDLGCAVANTLAGIVGGARQVECTVNGIGERAGNADLASIAMALKIRYDHYQAHTSLQHQELCRTAMLVSQAIGKPTPDTQPVVGKNAFAHASGIHGDGVIKHAGTYEIMRPADVGWEHEPFPLVPQSGRASLRRRLERLGLQCEPPMLEALYRQFLTLASEVKVVDDQHLYTLIATHHPQQ